MGTASALGALALITLVVAVIAGAAWGAVVVIGGLLLLGWFHLRNLQRLVAWTHDPIGTPLPRAMGVWNFVFADMSRRSRLAYDQRERLSAALERFREASQAMPDGVLYLSDEGLIEWANLKAEYHFGLDHSRDLGAPLTNLMRQPEFVGYLQSGQYADPLVMHSSRRAGLTLLVQVIPYGDDGQKMVISRDISQIEKLETMRRDFVANVSHELRTPLTVVNGFLETLVDGIDHFGRDEAIRFLTLAHEQSVRMERLIDDLLALSALETGAPPPAEEQVDVVELLNEVHRDAELLSAGRHQLSLDVDGGGTLFGSRKELCSAFTNLASNAVRYTPEGGTVRLQWRRDESGGEFCVEDSGIGIAAEHIPRLTERFYRVDRGRSRESGGTGLGLAIVKHVLTRHQAELRIDSVPGRGSRFSARFPAARLGMCDDKATSPDRSVRS